MEKFMIEAYLKNAYTICNFNNLNKYYIFKKKNKKPFYKNFLLKQKKWKASNKQMKPT